MTLPVIPTSTGMSELRRLVFVLFPFQGHITPMLQLATILHSKGFSITVVHTQLNSPDPSNHPHFDFAPIPDELHKSKLPPGDHTAAPVVTINRNCTAPFRKFMKQELERDEPSKKIAGVVYDWFMHFAQKVASELGLPCIGVRTTAAAPMLAHAAFHQTDQEGYRTFQDSLSADQVSELQSKGLKGVLTSIIPNQSEGLLQLQVDMTDATRNSSAIIVNTMDFLETETLLMIKGYFPARVFPIGPFHKIAPSSCTSLLKENDKCLSWLDKQTPWSVIYVSVGSLAVISEEELIEMAVGLLASQQPFLWVVRPGAVSNSEWLEKLPEDFQGNLRERGCIVEWAPQWEVLQHEAVGAFWSHCGWNSTLESVCEGVPMLCRPFFGDQVVNMTYICDVWKIGLELGNEIERGKITNAIRRLMVDTEGEEIRRRAISFKEKAKSSVEEFGPTMRSLDQLVEHINSFRHLNKHQVVN